MTEYSITVMITDKIGREIATACIKPGCLFQEAIEPIKLSDSPLSFFDTPRKVAAHVMTARRTYVANLTPQIERVLIDALSANDTLNGYTKKQMEDRNG